MVPDSCGYMKFSGNMYDTIAFKLDYVHLRYGKE